MPKITKLNPENFEQECTSVWSFARRGNWATHKSKYRGNWASEVVRNSILRFFGSINLKIIIFYLLCTNIFLCFRSDDYDE